MAIPFRPFWDVMQGASPFMWRRGLNPRKLYFPDRTDCITVTWFRAACDRNTEYLRSSGCFWFRWSSSSRHIGRSWALCVVRREPLGVRGSWRWAVNRWAKPVWKTSEQTTLDRRRKTARETETTPGRSSQQPVAASPRVRLGRRRCRVHRSTWRKRWSTSPFASFCAGCRCTSTTCCRPSRQVTLTAFWLCYIR